MRRNEFIETLKENLERNGVRDTGDIIEEYEEHFAFKLADGYKLLLSILQFLAATSRLIHHFLLSSPHLLKPPFLLKPTYVLS